MKGLKLTNDTIFRKKKMRSLKVYDLFWSLTTNKCKKFNLAHANIDDIIMTFLTRE